VEEDEGDGTAEVVGGNDRVDGSGGGDTLYGDGEAVARSATPR
jgi:hypothetical protein